MTTLSFVVPRVTSDTGVFLSLLLFYSPLMKNEYVLFSSMKCPFSYTVFCRFIIDKMTFFIIIFSYSREEG